MKLFFSPMFIIPAVLFFGCAQTYPSAEQLETADYGPAPSDVVKIIREYAKQSPREPAMNIGLPEKGYMEIDKDGTIGWIFGYVVRVESDVKFTHPTEGAGTPVAVGARSAYGTSSIVIRERDRVDDNASTTKRVTYFLIRDGEVVGVSN